MMMSLVMLPDVVEKYPLNGRAANLVAVTKLRKSDELGTAMNRIVARCHCLPPFWWNRHLNSYILTLVSKSSPQRNGRIF